MTANLVAGIAVLAAFLVLGAAIALMLAAIAMDEDLWDEEEDG